METSFTSFACYKYMRNESKDMKNKSVTNCLLCGSVIKRPEQFDLILTGTLVGCVVDQRA